MHIIFKYPYSDGIVLIRAALTVSHLEYLGSQKLNYETLVLYLESILSGLNAKEILIAYNDADSTWKLIYYYDVNGKFKMI